MSKIVQITTDTIVDNYGQVLQKEERNVIQYDAEPNYIKVYLDNILYLSDIPSGLNGVLMALLRRMLYNNEIVINAEIKRRIAEELSTTKGTIDNAITKFVKGQILIRTGVGVYLVNPHLFGKGKWENIEKIRLEVTFEPTGKTLKASIDKKTE